MENEEAAARDAGDVEATDPGAADIEEERDAPPAEETNAITAADVELVPLEEMYSGTKTMPEGIFLGPRLIQDLLMQTRLRAGTNGILAAIQDQKARILCFDDTGMPLFYDGNYRHKYEGPAIKDLYVIEKDVFEKQREFASTLYKENSHFVFVDNGEILMTGFGVEGEPVVLRGFPRACPEGSGYNAFKKTCVQL